MELVDRAGPPSCVIPEDMAMVVLFVGYWNTSLVALVSLFKARCNSYQFRVFTLLYFISNS